VVVGCPTFEPPVTADCATDVVVTAAPAVTGAVVVAPPVDVGEPLGAVVDVEWEVFALPADELSGSLLAPAQPPAAIETTRTPNPQARRHH
jgi:hypothetical protein